MAMIDEATAGSLFSGAGLLDFGLHLAGFQHEWFCESDEFRRGLLSRRFPDAVVFDDVRTIRGQAATDTRGGRWAGEGRWRSVDSDERALGADAQAVADAARDGKGGSSATAGTDGERTWPRSHDACSVDLIAGGFPCRGISSAGKRNGFEHAETVLWAEMRRVIGEVRPRYVLVENVAAILTMARAPGQPPGTLWGEVLADLATLGFDDIRWDCVPAAAVGAPHRRDRLFAVAANSTGRESGTDSKGLPRACQRDISQEAGRRGPRRSGGAIGQTGIAVGWGGYRPAIRRWEVIHGPAPEPLIRWMDDGDAKLWRVRARVDRSRLSALGDGVHVYVGWIVGLAIREHIRTGCWA